MLVDKADREAFKTRLFNWALALTINELILASIETFSRQMYEWLAKTSDRWDVSQFSFHR